MIKWFKRYEVLILILASSVPAAAQTANLRETPVVRAFQKNKNAVVSIAAKQVVQRDNDLFSMRLEDFFPFRNQQPTTLTSLGSGFIIHPRGYIVTNSHVVAGAVEISIIMPDEKGTSYPGRKIAVDPSCDLAVIKIDADRPLPTVTLGYSDDLMIGEPVLAIGNPYNYRQTLTDGIISAIHRNLQLDEEFTLPEMIQISAPINFGNSGGPLININGEVIGINTAIRKAAQNIGFAIPVDRLREKLPELLNVDNLHRTDLGLEVGDVRLKSPHGEADKQSVCIVIRAVRPDGGAAKAGLKVGDVIVALDGQMLRNALDFYLHLIEAPADSEISFDAIRPTTPQDISTLKGDQFTTVVTLHSRPKPDGNALAWEKFGLKFEPLNEAAIRRHNLAGRVGQLVVVAVQPDSPAAQAGVSPGDVLISFGNAEATSLDEFGLILETVKPDQVVTFNFSRTRKIDARFQQINQYSIPLRARATEDNPAKGPERIEL
jgi:serine protease Do